MEGPSAHRWTNACCLLVIYAAGLFFCLVTTAVRYNAFIPVKLVLFAMALGTLAGYRIGHSARGTILALAAAIFGIWLGHELAFTAFAPWLLHIVERQARH
jgi:hypothetical protein